MKTRLLTGFFVDLGQSHNPMGRFIDSKREFFVYGMMGRFGYEFHRNDIKHNNYIE